MENKYKALDPLERGYTRIGVAQLPNGFTNDIHFLKNITYDQKTKKVYVNFPIKEQDEKGRMSIIAKAIKENPEATIALINSQVIHPKN